MKFSNGKSVNSAQKPVRFWLEILKCVKAGVVFDLFSGTGSLSYAAIMMFKPFLAVEKHRRIARAAVDRLKVLTGTDFLNQLGYYNGRNVIPLNANMVEEEAETEEELGDDNDGGEEGGDDNTGGGEGGDDRRGGEYTEAEHRALEDERGQLMLKRKKRRVESDAPVLRALAPTFTFRSSQAGPSGKLPKGGPR